MCDTTNWSFNLPDKTQIGLTHPSLNPVSSALQACFFLRTPQTSWQRQETKVFISHHLTDGFISRSLSQSADLLCFQKKRERYSQDCQLQHSGGGQQCTFSESIAQHWFLGVAHTYSLFSLVWIVVQKANSFCCIIICGKITPCDYKPIRACKQKSRGLTSS